MRLFFVSILSMLTLSQVALAQSQNGPEYGYRLEGNFQNQLNNHFLTIGRNQESEQWIRSLNLVLPVGQSLNAAERNGSMVNSIGEEIEFSGKKLIGLEGQSLYRINDQLSLGYMGEVYAENTQTGLGVGFGPAANAKIVNTERFQGGVEARYDFIHNRYQLGGKIVRRTNRQ
jgi:hypothetical protein